MIVLDCGEPSARDRHLTVAAAAVRRGDLVLVPTETSYALATDALVARGTARLRAAKSMPTTVPLPILVPSAATVGGVARTVPLIATDLMTAFWPGSLTLLLDAGTTLPWDHPVGAPIAVRMPLQPVLLGLLRACGPLAVTAANAPGIEAPLTVDDAVAQLGEVAACALDVGPLSEGDVSTIVDITSSGLTGSGPRIVRPGAVGLDDLREVCPQIVEA